MQTFDNNSSIPLAVPSSKHSPARQIVGAFDANQETAAMGASQFFVTRAGAISLMTCHDREELRNVRLDHPQMIPNAPHTPPRATGDSVEDLANELQNDIESISQSIAMIDDRLMRQDNFAERQSLDTCRRRIERLSQWIQSVIDSSLLRQGKVQSCYRWTNIYQWMSKEQTRWSQLAKSSNVALTCEIHVDTVSRIWTDPQVVQRILENLIANAIEVSDHEQNIEIVVELSKDDEPWLIISVIDSSGSGIRNLPSHGQRPHFIELPDGLCPLHGHGLGLSVCMQLARMLGGYLDFTSLADKGTRFDLHLPAGGIFAWLRRNGRSAPSKHESTLLHHVQVDFGSLGPNRTNELDAFNEAIHRATKHRATIIQYDDSKWLLLPANEKSIHTDELKALCLSEFRLLWPKLIAPDEISIEIRQIAPLSQVIKSIDLALGDASSVEQLIGKQVPTPHLALKSPQSIPDIKVQDKETSIKRRIDSSHTNPKGTRISFRSFEFGSDSHSNALVDVFGK